MGTGTAPPVGRARRLHGDDDGVALVEFALLLPFLTILVFGTIDLGRAYSLKNSVTNMAREGAFVALGRPCPLTGPKAAALDEDDDLRNDVTVRVVAGTDPAASEISCPTNNVLPPSTQLTVVVRTEMALLTPLVGAVVGDPVAITGLATVESPPSLGTTTSGG
jgi:Flp pilus assembly protein TadG